MTRTLLEPARGLYRAIRRRVSPWRDDRAWLRWRFEQFVGRPPNLKEPKTFREKIVWLNLNYRDDLIVRMTDKVLARDEAVRRAGPELAVPELLGVWDRPVDVPWHTLPAPCVVKVTAASGWNLFHFGPDPIDAAASVAKLEHWMRRNYGDLQREWEYRRLKPRVMAERFMAHPDHPTRSPDDYKIHCFNGVPRFVQICADRRGSRSYECLDRDWKVLPLGLNAGKSMPVVPPKPPWAGEMFDLARKLAAGFPYTRVDLYHHAGRITFGEMTWFPFAGWVPMEDPATDDLLGSWLTLPPANRTAWDRITARRANRATPPIRTIPGPGKTTYRPA